MPGWGHITACTGLVGGSVFLIIVFVFCVLVVGRRLTALLGNRIDALSLGHHFVSTATEHVHTKQAKRN